MRAAKITYTETRMSPNGQSSLALGIDVEVGQDEKSADCFAAAKRAVHAAFGDNKPNETQLAVARQIVAQADQGNQAET